MHSDKPLVSIIVPAYNVEKYIEKCIKSLVDQSYTSLEILICDDCSKDETYDKVLKFSDQRIKVFKNTENRGVVYTRNFLLGIARGEFIALQDADDWSNPHRIERQINYLLEDKSLGGCGTQFTKIGMCGEKLFDSELPTAYETIREGLPEKFHFFCPSLMIRKSTYDKIGGYSEFFHNDGNEDIYWISKMVLKFRYENLGVQLYNYRLNVNSVTKNVKEIKYRKFYIHHITRILLNDYIKRDSNLLEEGKTMALIEMEATFKQELMKSPITIYEMEVANLLYWKIFSNSFIVCGRGILRNPFHIRAYRLLFYTIKEFVREYIR